MRCSFCGEEVDAVGQCACVVAVVQPWNSPAYGWICARCGASNSPAVLECGCDAEGAERAAWKCPYQGEWRPLS